LAQATRHALTGRRPTQHMRAARAWLKQMKKFSFRSVPFFIFIGLFLYLWSPVSVFTEMEEGFFRLFPRDPVFI
jgi:hypothetical protein